MPRYDLRGRRIPENEDVAGSAVYFEPNATGGYTKTSAHAKSLTDVYSAAKPTEVELRLRELIGQGGIQQLEQLNAGTLFNASPELQRLIDSLTTARQGSAKAALAYALQTASRGALSNAAGRGLARSSVQTRLYSQLSEPAIARFQQQMYGIEADKARLNIDVPRSDVRLRELVLTSPALTALQRARLADLNAKLNMQQVDLSARRQRSAENASWWGGIGKLAGTAIGFTTGGPGGAAMASQLGTNWSADAQMPGYNDLMDLSEI